MHTSRFQPIFWFLATSYQVHIPLVLCQGHTVVFVLFKGCTDAQFLSSSL